MASYKVMCALTLLTLLTLLTPVCGNPVYNNKIIGGQDAIPGSWPWQAGLYKSGSLFCGGSLISSQWVLTAAHCFPRTTTTGLVVYLGRQSLATASPNEVSRTVAQVIKHASYNANTMNNDITLLKLSSTVTFTNYIMPVCVAATGSTFHSGTNVWITGWGTTEDGNLASNLREAEVPIVGNKQCNCDYGFIKILDNMMCAGLRAGGKDTCQGDSGGPMVVKQNGRWVQAGITSFGTGCALAKIPGVYTRVSQYQSWINTQITSNQPGFVTFTSSGTDSDLNNTCPTVSPIVALPVQPSAQLCGKSVINPRIAGGQETIQGYWPWQAIVAGSASICGGSLINNQWVLTAAHCSPSADIKNMLVILGRYRLLLSTASEIALTVTQIIIHPNYVASTADNNISLLKLSSVVTFTNYILPVCLAASDSTYYSGTSTWVTGWGGLGSEEGFVPVPYDLREVEVPVVGNRQCNCNYGVGTITDNMMCAGSPAEGKGFCQGDNGGPLVSKQNSRWILGGVAFYGSGCTYPNLPGILTKVSKYQSWINSQITSDPPGFVTFTSNGTDSDLYVNSSNHSTYNDPPYNHHPSNHRSSNHNTYNNAPSNHPASNHHPSNHRSSNHHTYNDPPSNHQASNHHPSNHRSSNHHTYNDPSSNHPASNHHPSNHHTYNNPPSNHPASKHHPSNHLPSNHPPFNHPPFNQPPYNDPSSNHPLYNNFPSNHPASHHHPYNHTFFNHPPSNHPGHNHRHSNNPLSNHPGPNHPPSNHRSSNHHTYNDPPSNHPASNHLPSNHPPFNHPPFNQPPYNDPSSNHPLYNNFPSNHPASHHHPYNHTFFNHPASNHPGHNHRHSNNPPSKHPGPNHPPSNHPACYKPSSNYSPCSHNPPNHPASTHSPSSQSLFRYPAFSKHS
ncbi:hypothetical protein Q5P01_003158 [Channa striata]|uniref:Peptidase S1 domain-containing protein n=1 Tax=Channa striata TaxID=64152 RepID=A0AA88NSF4_CHASR|nr:hypothetical protein Q5P01_003158 [Channa striata]